MSCRIRNQNPSCHIGNRPAPCAFLLGDSPHLNRQLKMRMSPRRGCFVYNLGAYSTLWVVGFSSQYLSTFGGAPNNCFGSFQPTSSKTSSVLNGASEGKETYFACKSLGNLPSDSASRFFFAFPVGLKS